MKLAKRLAIGMIGIALAVPTFSFAGDSGPELYKQKCQMCHGATGEGGPRKLPELGSADVQKKSDADLTAIIEKGTKGQKGMMPAYGSKLSPGQIDVLVKFIRSLKK